MIPVILESPFAADSPGGVDIHVGYAQRCMLHSLTLGEAPFLSHLLYTQVLEDSDKEQRTMGIQAGFAWRKAAHKTVVYTDYGISEGMQQGINHAIGIGHLIEYRSLYGNKTEDCQGD